MIYDHLNNIDRYGNFNFILKDYNKDEFTEGRFELSGDDEFGICLVYQTKEEEESLWEAHRQYLDIHIIIEGEEFVQISDISKMASIKDYESDYELFDGEKEQQIYLRPGYFLILFPNEVHKTSIKTSADSLYVKKKVYKKAIL